MFPTAHSSEFILMLMDLPLVGIVILNWNNAAETVACLSSIFHLDYPNILPLVVDNGSTDDSLVQIASSYSQVELLHLENNVGYAEGNNAGLSLLIERDCDYLLVLNNDTLVNPDMLSHLVIFMEANPQAAMSGPIMYCTNPSDYLFAAGSFVDWRRGEIRHRGLFQPLGNFSHLVNPEQVDFIVGCGVLARRKSIERIGLFNLAYYLNFEDVEWGVHARKLGYQVWYVPQACLRHKVSATLGQASPANTYYMTRNSLLFFCRNTPGLMRYATLTRILLRTLRTIIAWSFNPKYKSEIFRKKRDANIYALRDFFIRRYGKMGDDVYSICYPKKH